MKNVLVAVVALLAAATVRAGGEGPVAPFETDGAFVPKNAVDQAVLASLRKLHIEPARPCSDAVFLRRVYLDVLGTLPSPRETAAFLRDRRPGKRAALIERLFDREEFADYQALRWCDLLRVKAEFPINLWPNAVQAYHHWVRAAIRDDMPYDRFARELLTASGSNFRVPPVNFCRAVPSREPAGLAQAAALTFLGSRIEDWPAERRDGLAVFFSRVAFKKTSEWKEEIVYLGPPPGEPLHAVFPDGKAVEIPPDADPRQVLADWMVKPGNAWFSRCVVNRIWAWLMGRGIVHEPDRFGPDNPPSNPALLDLLAKELVLADFDLRHVYRLILSSATYQQSPIPRSDSPEATAQFAHYGVRRLPAEVLIDAICSITGSTEKYMSAIPEPFTFIPEDQRSIALSDGSISSPFLEMFGRPVRDSGTWEERNNQPTAEQRLYLLNSRDIQRRIDRSWKLGLLLRRSRGDIRRTIRSIYLVVLSREPTDEELAAAEKYARRARMPLKSAADDLVWALFNTKEFLYRH